MRVEGSVTSISWIPSEAISGVTRLPFDMKVGHYDSPPPDRIDTAQLGAMRDRDEFRFANHLAGWIEVEDGRITGYSQQGSGVLNNTHMRLTSLLGLTFKAHAFPDLRTPPEVSPTSITFTQTAGGRPGMPAPRLVRNGLAALVPPAVWTTLRLTLHADGRIEGTLAGATPFPRHWVYDHEGNLAQKTATISFEDWYERKPGTSGTPWGAEDSEPFVTMAESALERELSFTLMRTGKPSIRTLAAGDLLTRQGDPADGLFVLLDGMVSVDVDGRDVGELGPGAVVGERAMLEGGTRTATLRAVTPAKVAVVDAAAISDAALRDLTEGHRREEG
ncbi:MAG: cyclic nucleotide-binding domain-containing protein [Acidimicrobiia bacterium]|nr:cyclic nucleotide-binding domain-containing protein [Acidimicrobiia bacterium]